MEKSIIVAPLVTEKSTAHTAKGKYAFVVHNDATKIDVMNAFEKLYGVKAAKVNMSKTSEKTRMTRYRTAMIKRPSFKKAIVTTKSGKTVDVNKIKELKK